MKVIKSSKSSRKLDKTKKEIAVIGIACRFPGAKNYKEFWCNLINGVQSIKEINRWDFQKLYSDCNEENKCTSKWLGFLDDIYKFDNGFFNISPREAIHMDPHQRLLLEEAWHCIEDSGVTLKKLQERKSSVHVGSLATSPYYGNPSPEEVDIYSGTGNYFFMLSNRVSYFLGLNGVSKTIDTACSSTAIAVYDACTMLTTGESDFALVAGVDLHLSPLKYLMWSKNRMLSAAGKCKTFDKDADGFVGGEGVGVLLLQPLEQAIEDRNHIYGVIKGCAANHGGKSSAVFAPRVEAQKDVILSAYKGVGYGPDTVTYIEAHGTGTSLGDPIEIEALTQAFQQYTAKKQFCKIGSVKTNVGHLAAAAGMPGIIKILLMLQCKKIVPSLNMHETNPIIDFENSPFSIATHVCEWERLEKEIPLRAGISSFGYGGVNCHILFEEFCEKIPEIKDPNLSPYPFIISAKTPQSLENIIKDWGIFTKENGITLSNFRDACLTLLTGREAFPYRYGKLVRNQAELLDLLDSEYDRVYDNTCNKQSCYLSIGENQWNSNFEWELLCSEYPIFREKVNYILNAVKEFDLDNTIYEGFFQKTWPKTYVPVYSFILTYSIVSVLMEIGLPIGTVTGCKDGFWAALAAGKILSLNEILMYLSGKSGIDELSPVRPVLPFYDPIGSHEIRPFIVDRTYLQELIYEIQIPDDILQYYMQKARLLYSSQFTFKKYLEEWSNCLKNLGLDINKLLDEHGYLSLDSAKYDKKKLLFMIIVVSSFLRVNQKWNISQRRLVKDDRFYELLDLVMDEIVPKDTLILLLKDDITEYGKILRIVNERINRLNINSNKPYIYLTRHNRKLTEISDFKAWIKEMLSLEALPSVTGNLMIDFGKIKRVHECRITIVSNMREKFINNLKEALTLLCLEGCDINWAKLYDESSFHKVPLPVYSFEQHSFWLPEKIKDINISKVHESDMNIVVPVIHPLLHKNTSNFSEYKFTSTFYGNEFFIEKYAKGGKCFSGMACLEMARAAANYALDTDVEDIRERGKMGIEIKNIVWGQPIIIGDNPFHLHIGLYPENDRESAFEIYSDLDTKGHSNIHMQGYVRRCEISMASHLDIQKWKSRCNDKVFSSTQCYDVLSSIGVNIDTAHKTISNIYAGPLEALVQLTLPELMRDSKSPFLMHPLIMESAIQASLILPALDNSFISYTFSKLEQVDVYEGCSPEMLALVKYGKEYNSCDKDLETDIDIYNQSGVICIKIKGLKITLHENSVQSLATGEQREVHFITKQWEISPGTYTETCNRTVAVLVTEETEGLGNCLKEYLPYCRILDSKIIDSELFNSAEEWKSYGGFIDLTGCGSKSIDLMGWLEWLQRLIGMGCKDKMMLLCVTKGLEAYQNTSINLSGALHAGLFRMLQSEYSHLRSRHMDGEMLIKDKDFALQIAQEFLIDSDETEVCYRNGIRYKAFLGEIKGFKGSKTKKHFPDDHVLLITGGVRGLGYLCASHFIKEYGVKRLVLTGREEIPPREEWYRQTNPSIIQKINRIRDLEAQGIRVMVMPIVLTDPQNINESLNTIKNMLGPIGGVIHCAGLLDTDNPAFIRKSAENISRILDPKVKGCSLLYEAFINEPLQFFILFSSVSAIVPTLAAGHSDYTMANAYMDYFAQSKNNLYPVISIQWPNWQETGMGEVKSKAYRQTGLLSHTNAEGLALLDHILSQPLVPHVAPVVLPAVVNPELWRPEKLMRSNIVSESGVQKVPAQVMDGNEVTEGHDMVLSATQRWLIKVFSQELNIDAAMLEVDTPFQNFGIDSIFLAQIVKRIEKEIQGASIEPSSLLEYPTIKSFADFFVGAYSQSLYSILVNNEVQNINVDSQNPITVDSSENCNGLKFEVETWLTRMFSDELNISLENMECCESFQDLGMDSIFLAQIVKRMEKELGSINVEPSLLLEYPSINDLADFMIKTYPESLSSLFSRRIKGIDSEGHIKQEQGIGLATFRRTGLSGISIEKSIAVMDKVAVVGMACHFPDAENTEQYWHNLRIGRDSIYEVPKSRWDWEKYYSLEYKEGKVISKWGGFLKNIQEFDPNYFNISESLAPQIDPLQRQWLEVSMEALSDAGFTKEVLSGKQIGVFVGTRTGAFSQKLANKRSDTIVGIGQNFISVHLAHILNFKGPNMVVDTACSSSLTAIHLAVRSIQNGESEVALAGGVDILDESVYEILSAAKILSPDGHCKTFDAEANGIGVGEGCGVLVLKPLSRAIQDNDKIYGVIDGSAINNDGNTMGVTTPNPEAQRELIKIAIADAKINPETISYVEAHGTGTLIGDPIELRGLTRVLEEYTSKNQFCGVGSVKSNIGHLLSASGAASIIKVLLSIIHKEIPPSIHCNNPNPRFNFKESPLFLIRELKNWETEGGILRAGISSFGLGGNNAHIIVSNEGVPDTHRATLKAKGERVVFNRARYWPLDDEADLKREPPKNGEISDETQLSRDEKDFMDFFNAEVVI